MSTSVFQFDRKLCALRRLDVNSDGKDEILVSTIDGQTFIVTQDGDVSTFFLDQEICSFNCGLFSLDPGLSSTPVPVLMYGTYSNQIYLYYNVKLAQGK